MITRFFKIILFIVTFFLVFILFLVFKLEEYDFNELSKNIIAHQQKYFFNQAQNELEKIRLIIKNEKEFIDKEYKKHIIFFAKDKISEVLEKLKLFNPPPSTLQKIIQTILIKGDDKIDIIKNSIIIASSNLSKVGKKIELECNPFSYGSCYKMKKNSLIYIHYSPKYDFLIQTEIKVTPDYNLIKDTLLSFPNLIVIKNGKILKGEFKNNCFYFFEYCKKLNIFYGIEVNYENFNKNIYSIIDEINKRDKEAFEKILIILLSILSILILLIYIFTNKKAKKFDKILEEYKERSIIDNLTGLFTRAYLNELEKCNFNILLILDLDNFKYINDAYGHKMGDMILKEFSFLLQKYFKDDIIVRWGGDEFIIFSNKSKNLIKDIIVELNKKIDDIQKSIDKNLSKLSVSGGGCSKNLPYEEKFKNADLALYKVKKTKKGKVLFYEDIDYIKIENQ